MILLAGLALGLCLLCWWPPRARLPREGPAAAPAPALRLPRVLAIGVFVVLLLRRPEWWSGLALLAVGAGLGWWIWRERGRRVAMARTGQQVAEACRVLAAQLSIGALPEAALRTAAGEVVLLAPVQGAIDLGTDLPGVLRRISQRPGAEGLGELAAAWQLAGRTGAPLSAEVSRVAEALREGARTDQTIGAELASSRASGRLLAGLPLAGLAMGALVGGDPLHFLLTSSAGRLCLVLAAGLSAVGLVWTDLLARTPRSLA